MAVHPDDIAAELFAKRVIKDDEKAEVDLMMYTVPQRMDGLLTAVHRAIQIDSNNFHIFLDVLGAIPKYEDLAERMKASMRGVQD